MVNVKPEQFQKIWSALITPTNEDESVNYAVSYTHLTLPTKSKV